MSTYLSPAALGLGDLVVILPVVQSLIRSGRQVFLVVRAAEHMSLTERIPGIAGAILEWQLPSEITSADEHIDLRDHPLQREHWWGSKPFEQAYPNWHINEILAAICGDKGLHPDFANLQPLLNKRRDGMKDSVVFLPGSAVSFKCWSTANWLKLASLLSDKFAVFVIGQPDSSTAVRDLIAEGCSWIETPSLADALDVVSSCAAVVSVDTGIMHLAVQQGTPTVGMFRWAPVYIREQANFRSAIAQKPCADICYEREVECAHHQKTAAGPGFEPADWGCQANAGTHCMDTIEPEQVLQLVKLVRKAKSQHDRRRQQINSLLLPAAT